MAELDEPDLPLASPAGEKYAMDRVGERWREMGPEEWVARYIHTCPLWGWAAFRFPTPEFDRWMREAERYVFDLGARRELRRKYLTEEEIAEVEEYEADPL